MQNHHFLGFYHIFLLSLFSKSEIYCKWHLQIHAGPDNFWHETHKTRSREANHKFKFHKKAIHRGLKTLSLGCLLYTLLRPAWQPGSRPLAGRLAAGRAPLAGLLS